MKRLSGLRGGPRIGGGVCPSKLTETSTRHHGRYKRIVLPISDFGHRWHLECSQAMLSLANSLRAFCRESWGLLLHRNRGPLFPRPPAYAAVLAVKGLLCAPMKRAKSARPWPLRASASGSLLAPVTRARDNQNFRRIPALSTRPSKGAHASTVQRPSTAWSGRSSGSQRV